MAQSEEGLAPKPTSGNGLVGELQVLALGWDWPARTRGPAQLVEVSKKLLIKRKQPNEHEQQKTTQTTDKEQGTKTAREGSGCSQKAFQMCPSTALPLTNSCSAADQHIG